MNSLKKYANSKLNVKEINNFINESQFIKNPVITKQGQKLKKDEEREIINENSKLIGHQQPASAKKRKANGNNGTSKESRQKLLGVMGDQIQARNEGANKFLDNLADLISNLEGDYDAIKTNEQKLEHLTGAFMKCIHQDTVVQKQKLATLTEIHSSFKKECEEMECAHKGESSKFANEIENDINKLQQKLISDTKRNEWEALQQTLFSAMHTEF